MPAGFDNCVRNGGRVRTMKMSGDRFVHVCFLNGKSYRGYVKKKKKMPMKSPGGAGHD